MVQEGVDGGDRHLIHPCVVDLEVVARGRSHGRAVAVVLLRRLLVGGLWSLVCGVWWRLIRRLLIRRLLVGWLLCRLLVRGLLVRRLLHWLLHWLLIGGLLHRLLLGSRRVGLRMSERAAQLLSSSQWDFQSHDCTASALRCW